MSPDPNSFLLETDRPELVRAVQHVLSGAGIPYQTGMQPYEPPWVVFFVPGRRLREARGLIQPYLVEDDVEALAEEDERLRESRAEAAVKATFPWHPVQLVSAVMMFHLSLVFLGQGGWFNGPDLLHLGGITKGLTLSEPWRLVTAMFLHVDAAHALWNGISMLVFAVPLILDLGSLRTAAIYLAAGVGGGICALAFSLPGSTVVGSSGAVAGLFGAWVVLALKQARHATIGWRARIRSLGIALLFLPSLLSPAGADGRPVSVASHLGGLMTGMAIGALLSDRMLARREVGQFSLDS